MMRSFKLEPFLWIHLSGILVALLLLEGVGIALGIGTPLPLFWLELLFVAIFGIVPVFWMQWHRPFDIFSVLILALKPEEMDSDQKRILSLFKNPKQRVLTVIAAIVLLVVLWFLYKIAPIASLTVPFLPQSRFLGLLLAAIFFLLANLFVQVPISVMGILLTSQEKFSSVQPYPTEKIATDFSIPGFKVKKILPISDKLPEITEDITKREK